MAETMGTLGPAALCLGPFPRPLPGLLEPLRTLASIGLPWLGVRSVPVYKATDSRFLSAPHWPWGAGVPLTLRSGCVLRCCMASQQRDRNHLATGQTGATPFSTPGLAAEE